MKKESDLSEKIFTFGSEIVEICRLLMESKTEIVFCNQLISYGTAVGAMMREAEFAQSRSDFIHKLSIAFKEANEPS